MTQFLKESPLLAQDGETWGWLRTASKNTAFLRVGKNKQLHAVSCF